jgi:hypothetical protein
MVMSRDKLQGTIKANNLEPYITVFSLVTLMMVSVDGPVSPNPQLIGEVPACGRQEGAQEE